MSDSAKLRVTDLNWNKATCSSFKMMIIYMKSPMCNSQSFHTHL